MNEKIISFSSSTKSINLPSLLVTVPTSFEEILTPSKCILDLLSNTTPETSVS